jgi:hypothetical protein
MNGRYPKKKMQVICVDDGSIWIRLFNITQIIRITLGEAFKFAVMVQLLLFPFLPSDPGLWVCVESPRP